MCFLKEAIHLLLIEKFIEVFQETHVKLMIIRCECMEIYEDILSASYRVHEVNEIRNSLQYKKRIIHA